MSCDATEKESTKDAVDTSKGAVSVYSFTSSPSLPTTNIFPPLAEKARPCGNVSCDATEKESTKDAVDTSKGWQFQWIELVGGAFIK